MLFDLCFPFHFCCLSGLVFGFWLLPGGDLVFVRLRYHFLFRCLCFAGRAMAETDSVSKLLAERKALNSSTKEVGQLLRAAKQRKRASQRRADKMWQLTPWQSKVLLIIYVLAGYRAAPAVRFLSMQARKLKWFPRPDEEVQGVVENLFVEAESVWVAGLADQSRPLDIVCMKAAIAFLHQFEVAVWVLDLNRQRGVAPPTEMILGEFEDRRLQYSEDLRPRSVGLVTEVRARVWARQWRERWGGRHARIRIKGDDMEAPEMQEKVCFFCGP